MCVGGETDKQIKLSKCLESLKSGERNMGVPYTSPYTFVSVGDFPLYKSSLNF